MDRKNTIKTCRRSDADLPPRPVLARSPVPAGLRRTAVDSGGFRRGDDLIPPSRRSPAILLSLRAPCETASTSVNNESLNTCGVKFHRHLTACRLCSIVSSMISCNFYYSMMLCLTYSQLAHLSPLKSDFRQRREWVVVAALCCP